MAASESTAMPLRITSLNVLNPKMTGPKFFPDLPPEARDEARHRRMIVEWVEAEMAKGVDVICLQEFHRDLLWPLKRHLRALGWDLVARFYHHKYVDHMGVVLLWNPNALDLDGDDALKMPRPGQIVEDWGAKHDSARVAPPEDSGEDWKGADYSAYNETLRNPATAILGRFRLKRSPEKVVVIGTFHMPCRFRGTTRAEVTLQWWGLERALRQLGDSTPGCAGMVIVGDWNMPPLEEGTPVDKVRAENDPSSVWDPRSSRWPFAPDCLPWTDEPDSSTRFRSVAPPTITNKATGPAGMFEGTLDYGFVTSGLDASATTDPILEPLPSVTWFSDHVPMRLTVSI